MILEISHNYYRWIKGFNMNNEKYLGREINHKGMKATVIDIDANDKHQFKVSYGASSVGWFNKEELFPKEAILDELQDR